MASQHCGLSLDILWSDLLKNCRLGYRIFEGWRIHHERRQWDCDESGAVAD